MSLCITYRLENGKCVSISDSLLTTTAKKSLNSYSDIENGAYLPSDQEILHQTPYGIKVHIISQTNSIYSSRFDIVVSIAGNVSLGLQSLLFLDSYLKGISYIWAEHIPQIIEEKIYMFWNNARDQELQMSFILNNHKRKNRIFELNASGDSFSFDEVQEEHGILLSVIGDCSLEVKSDIYNQINTLLYSLPKMEEAIHYSCITALLKKNYR